MVFILLFSLVTIGCTDSSLVKLSQALNDTALAVGTLQAAVIQANKQGSLSDASTQQVLTIAYKVNIAGKEAVAVTRSISKLSAADKSNLLVILNPIIAAVGEGLDSLKITDPNVSANIRAALLAIQTGLNTAQLIIAGGK
jgi:hypothetical protein